jgi:hypothetical protein
MNVIVVMIVNARRKMLKEKKPKKDKVREYCGMYSRNYYEPTFYDYYKGDKSKLSADGKSIHIVLIPNLNEDTFNKLGILGMLKGKALGDYEERK